MEKLVKPARLVFAIGILAFGILCMLANDFIVGRPPAWSAGFDVNPVLAYASGIALILAAGAIIVNKKAGLASLFTGGLILMLSVFRHWMQFTNDWLNGLKAMALVGGALIIASSFFNEDSRIGSSFRITERVRETLVAVGCVLLAVFFVACGYAHFKFAEFIDGFIPAYLPFHAFWTYFCGVCLVAGGVGLLIPGVRRWAALLSGVMLSGWFVLLHIPRFMANPNDLSDQLGLCESFTFAGIFLTLAGLLSRNGKRSLRAVS